MPRSRPPRPARAVCPECHASYAVPHQKGRIPVVCSRPCDLARRARLRRERRATTKAAEFAALVEARAVELLASRGYPAA